MEKKPTWWLLYAIGAGLVALVALAEVVVPAGGGRATLEVFVVVVMFALMLRWVHANRGRIELAEAGTTRPQALEATLRNGAAPAVPARRLTVPERLARRRRA